MKQHVSAPNTRSIQTAAQPLRSPSVHRASWKAAFALLASAVTFSLAAPVRASTAVIVPARVEKGVSSEDAERAVQELTRLIRAHSFDVISPGQASVSAEDAQQSGGFPRDMSPNDCVTPECASEYRKLFDATFAVQLSLFAEGKKPSTVGVVITDSPKAYFGGTSAIEGGDIAGAVQRAYLTARERHLRGAGPWLTVQGGPPGAMVYVDGAEFGRLPLDKRHLEPGMHRLQVRQDGYITQNQVLTVPARIDHEESVTMQLMAMAPGHDRAPDVKLDRTWDYVVGGALAAAGVVHLGMGIQQKLKEGDCAEENRNGTCKERYGDIDGVARENLLLGLGGASIVMGGAVMWGAPIAQLRVHANKDMAALSVVGGF